MNCRDSFLAQFQRSYECLNVHRPCLADAQGSLHEPCVHRRYSALLEVGEADGRDHHRQPRTERDRQTPVVLNERPITSHL